MQTPFAPQFYLDLAQTEWPELFESIENAWEVLPKLGGVFKLGDRFKPANYGTLVGSPVIGEQVFIGKGTVIEPGAYIKGPAYIGENCQIRHGAYIRENVIIGAGSVVGNSCEVKNSIFFKECQVPHFNYVGDSILGYKTHLAAGVILSNLKLHGDVISIRTESGVVSTGLRKFGALVGDYAEVGCNAVLNPGSIIGRRSLIYPGVAWRGVLPENSIAKETGKMEARRQ
jgi:NDP-sugar pyrophosphorylase family protein